MFGKKFGIIGFLALCLTSLFLALATTSTTSSSEYDPWVDLNDDGVIDSTDLGMLGVAWGSTGTPINKTALLLELQSKVETLEAQVQSINQTMKDLTNRSFGVPKFLYSDGGFFDLSKICEQGTTGWVTAKTATVPANTLTNGTVVVYLNWVSYRYLGVGFTCHARIVVAEVEKAYWSWGPPDNNPPAVYEAMDTSYHAAKLSGIDNSADVIVTLDFKIDCTVTQNPTHYARISNNQFIVEG